SPRTLRSWDEDHLAHAPIGRPPARSALPVRQAILGYLKLTGPGVGVPTLHKQFADVTCAELADLLRRYRAVWRARHRSWRRVLHWQTPGRVWAIDFTEAPQLTGYPSRYLLAARDLASGCMLAWQPVPNLTEEVTMAALARLFAT